MPRVLIVVGGAVAIVTLVLAAAVASEQSASRELDGAQSAIAAARETIGVHARETRAEAQRLLASAERSASPHREHWMSDARSMLSDAARLDATASLLESQASLLGMHPGRSVRSDLAYIHTAGDALVAEGDQLLAHAATARTHVAQMAPLAQANETDIGPIDVVALREGATRIADAGGRVRSVGVALGQVGAQLMRSLGR